LKSCPFRWHCPVKSPTIHINWSLLNFNRSFDLLAEGPSISSFACLSPVMGSHYLIYYLNLRSLHPVVYIGLCIFVNHKRHPVLDRSLATLNEMPLSGSGAGNGYSDPVLARWSADSFPAMPSCPGTHVS
jgi:hypothetical protein